MSEQCYDMSHNIKAMYTVHDGRITQTPTLATSADAAFCLLLLLCILLTQVTLSNAITAHSDGYHLERQLNKSIITISISSWLSLNGLMRESVCYGEDWNYQSGKVKVTTWEVMAQRGEHQQWGAMTHAPRQPQADEQQNWYSDPTHQSETLHCRGRWPVAVPSPDLALKNNDFGLTSCSNNL